MMIIVFFPRGLDIFPSLLHGDLWSGNVGQVGELPCVYDPASLYGHHEFDLAIGRMFGGFSREFYTAYHARIPRTEGADHRGELYQLFHYLNHWNHFGEGYRGESLAIMKKLIRHST